MATFSKPVVVTPKKSQPTAAQFPARGVWTIDNISVIMENDAPMSTRVVKLGIKYADFKFVPMQGDFISSKAGDLPLGYLVEKISPSAMVDFIIDNDQPDGQGGCTYIMKRSTARL